MAGMDEQPVARLDNCRGVTEVSRCLELPGLQVPYRGLSVEVLVRYSSYLPKVKETIMFLFYFLLLLFFLLLFFYFFRISFFANPPPICFCYPPIANH